MKLLVINGPNLNMLGIRERHLYGTQDYAQLCAFLAAQADALGVEVEVFQSNHEGAIVDCIQGAYQRVDGIVINPAAYTHTSVAILDALKAVNIRACEVHLTDVTQREDYRKISFVREACEATFTGEGFESYRKAMAHLANAAR
ncbi:MAG: 3-dehydroquinate dehydratase [Oscillospiraceae bacterium]|jgi:3-dehydroquinate dehydratase-2|nr:3-dehydroquinate dehydratase [Oscillospiraceae bacterium]